ncbi:MAG TPA: DNA polymerase III subunit gamma/tau [Anaerovoracaceae bacterium]|nr:DNA polymerase III subunit gamma/tau [Anaerovoracaceae bacterium]
MYKALYRAYRPETFESLLGQEHIIKILKNQIETGTTSHAYLFCGTRGTGKTTVARILAKALNCSSEGEKPCGVCQNCQDIRDGVYMDVIEIDAASNNGVDNIRELKESVKYPPAIGKNKVYIIDEVHMLSPGAFNALLKTLEEPPEYVTFILATTEVHKLPATILSRCLRLDFRRVSEAKLKQGMKNICKDLDVHASDAAIGIIAANADGSVRDGLSILDQCISAGNSEISREDVLEYLGTPGEEIFIKMTDFIINKNAGEALLLLDGILSEGKEVRQFMKDWVSHYRNLMLSKFMKKPEELLNMSCENVDRIREQSERIDMSEINEGIMQLAKTINDARWTTQPRILLELCIVNLAYNGGFQLPKAAGEQVQRPKAIQVQIPKNDQPELDKNQESKTGVKKEESKTEAKETAKVLKSECGADLDSLWHKIFEDGETVKGSFNLIRTGTTLKEINDTVFKIEAITEIKKSYVMDNKLGLEHLMEKHTGKVRMLECFVLGVEKKPDDNKRAEEQKMNIENKFGISIEIE